MVAERATKAGEARVKRLLHVAEVFSGPGASTTVAPHAEDSTMGLLKQDKRTAPVRQSNEWNRG